MARAASPPADASVRPGSRHGRIAVCCRMRPLLDNEVAKGVVRASWVLTDTSISLRERVAGRTLSRDSAGRDSVDGQVDGALSKTRSELRALDHLRRSDNETVMDRVFGESATTTEVYEHSFRDIVEGAADGLNGAILAYGQTNSGKTFSISGASAKVTDSEEPPSGMPAVKGIVHFALEDLFGQLRTKSESGDREYLVRMSYCEIYMERVNDLLRKIGPQSQHLAVKEDAETHSFYVEGLKEKIVGSAEEVIALLTQAEKRRRVAYTRYNEVSSRSHTLMTLCVECSAPLEASAGAGESSGDEPRMTRIGRLVIVDLAGNERVEAGTEYMAESNSINKSLFFLGKVIEKLSSRHRTSANDASTDTSDAPRTTSGEHVPIRESKLTRLLSVHLGGNSRTGVLVTMTPAEEFVEQSLTTLRFAQKASTIRCVAKPVLVSKEQSLIIKQREIIAQLHQQVRELKEAQERNKSEASPRPLPPQPQTTTKTGTAAETTQREVTSPSAPSAPKTEGNDLDVERQQTVEQIQAMTLGAGLQPRQGFVSKSKEVDAVVSALLKRHETERRQKMTVMGELRDLHRTVTEIVQDITSTVSAIQSSGDSATSGGDRVTLIQQGTTVYKQAWGPAINDLRSQIQNLLDAACASSAAAGQQHRFSASHKALASQPGERTEEYRLREEVARLRNENLELGAKLDAAARQAKPAADPMLVQLREENARLRASMRLLSSVTTERSSNSCAEPAKEAEEIQTRIESPCKRSDGTGERASPLFSGNRFVASGARGSSSSRQQSPLSTTRPSTNQKQSSPFSASSGHGLVGHDSDLGGSTRFSSSCGLGEFEPIIERCTPTLPTPPSIPRPAGVPPAPSSSGLSWAPFGTGREVQLPVKPPKPAEQRPVSEIAPRLAMDYFRQLGVRTSWQPGDTAYWRGQACRVVRAVPEDRPLCVVLLTPRGSEVTTDLCLLSESLPTGSRGPSSPTPADAAKPLRLAPLDDLCLERPSATDRPPVLPAAGHSRVENATSHSRGSLASRSISPLRPLSSSRGIMDSHAGRQIRCSSPSKYSFDRR